MDGLLSCCEQRVRFGGPSDGERGQLRQYTLFFETRIFLPLIMEVVYT